MASADRVELPDIFEANAAKLSLKHHFRVKRDFDDLSEVIDLLPSPADETFHPSYAPFLQLLLTAKSPRWEDVEASLESTFGSERGEKMVIPGEWGIGAVREVIGRAIFEAEVAELPKARYWIAWLESSVQYTRDRLLTRQPGTTSPPIDNGASSTSQASVSNDRRNPSVSAKSTSPSHPKTNNVLTADANGREVSSDLSSLSRSQSLSIDPNPDTGSDFLIHLHREQSVQPPLSPRNDGPRKRSRGDSPSPLPEGKPRRSKSPRKVDKGKQRAVESESEDEFGGIAENDEAGVEARNEQSQAKKRRTRSSVSASKPIDSPYLDEDDDDAEDEDEEESGKESEKEDSDFEGSEGDEEDSDEEPVQPVGNRGSSGAKRIVIDDEDDVQRDGIEADPSNGIMTHSNGVHTAAGSSRIRSAEEELVRSIFPSIPANIILTPSPTLVPAYAHVDQGFTRKDIQGNLQKMVNTGKKDKDIYRQNTNHLCMTINMNICSIPSKPKRIFEAGQPVVAIGRQSKCQVIIDGIIAKPGIGKKTTFINVWVNNDSVKVKGKKRSRWFYKGMYEVAYDGSKKGKGEYLPESAVDTIHEELVKRIKTHATINSKDMLKTPPEARVHEVLESWDFESRDLSGVKAELNTKNTGGRKRHVKYVALRCIGWDHKSWKIWTARRNAREDEEG